MANVQITTGGAERIEPAADLLSEAFRADPTIIYLLNSPSSTQRTAYLPTFFRALLTAAAANGATFDETGGWKSCGVVFPSGSQYEWLGSSLYPQLISMAWSIGFTGCYRMLWEMPHATKACKAKALRDGEEYFYIFLLGTREDWRGRGLCSAMVRHYQSVATKVQAPIYMEAATEYCWRLYQRLEFETVGEIVLGEGKAKADGSECVGGPGFKLWGMIWRPEKVKERA